MLPVTAKDGTPALLGLAEDGSAAVCRTDGGGTAVAVAEWASLEGATVTTSYDLARDSLPIVSWAIWHPSFPRVAGALTISGTDLSYTDHRGIADVLRRLGAEPRSFGGAPRADARQRQITGAVDSLRVVTASVKNATWSAHFSHQK